MSAPAPKVKKAPKAPAAHPKYSVMIAAAITTLKDRTGSSRQAILKYICANYKVDAVKAAVQVRMALKRGVAKGALKMARASGKGAGSFKVVKVEKPKKVKKAKKPKAKKVKKVKKVKKAAKKPAAKKAKKPKKAAKKPAAKKPAAKKPAAKKPAAKKPAAKKPAAKKAAPKK
jgi:histone H1/5